MAIYLFLQRDTFRRNSKVKMCVTVQYTTSQCTRTAAENCITIIIYAYGISTATIMGTHTNVVFFYFFSSSDVPLIRKSPKNSNIVLSIYIIKTEREHCVGTANQTRFRRRVVVVVYIYIYMCSIILLLLHRRCSIRCYYR